MIISDQDYIYITAELRKALNLLELLHNQKTIAEKIDQSLKIESTSYIPLVMQSSHKGCFDIPLGYALLGRTNCGAYIVDTKGYVYRYTYNKNKKAWIIWNKKNRDSKHYICSIEKSTNRGDILWQGIHKKFPNAKYQVSRMKRFAKGKSAGATHFDVYTYARNRSDRW